MDKAVILAEGFLGSTYGKTANGLCRFSKRYDILGVIDSTHSGASIQEIVPKARPDIKIISTMGESLHPLQHQLSGYRHPDLWLLPLLK